MAVRAAMNMNFSVLSSGDAERSFATRAQRLAAQSIRLRTQAASVRLFSQAVIAKGRVLREQSKRQRID